MADSWISIVDNAVKTLVFQYWLNCLSINNVDTDTVLSPKDLALRKISEKRGTSKDAEFISIWPSSPQMALDREHTPLATRGLEIDMQDGTFQTIKSQPIKLFYSLTVWSLSRNNLNKVIENYVWWKYRNPKLNIILNQIIPLGMNLHFGEIQDDSPVSAEYTQGLFYRQTFPLQIDAVLLDVAQVELIESVQLKIASGLDLAVAPTLVSVNLEASG